MLTALVLGCLAATATAPAVAAAPRITPLPIPSTARYVGSDGAGRIVTTDGGWEAPTLSVLDLATRRVTSSFGVPLPGCGAVASPGGLGATCSYDPRDNAPYHLFVRGYGDAGWTAVRLPWPSAIVNTGVQDVSIAAVGRRWLGLRVGGYHWYEASLLPRGGADTITLKDPRDTAGTVPSLDTADPRRALCRPLRRSPRHYASVDTDERWAPFLYAKPWAIDRPAYDAYDRNPITLLHCGSRKVITLCRVQCREPGLSAGLATWSDGDVGYVRDLRTGRTTPVRVAGHTVTLKLVGSYVVVVLDDPSTTDRQAPTYGLLRR